MGAFRTKLIGMVAVGLIVYASSIVQSASQTPDSVAIPKTSWEKLESAINGVAEAFRAIRSAQTPMLSAQSPAAQSLAVQSTSPPASTAANQLIQDYELPATTTQVYLEGKWETEWPWEIVKIKSARVEDPRYPGGRLTPEFDGTYRLTAEPYGACYYNIALSPDRNKMFWVPTNNTNRKPLTNAVVSGVSCRPATIFYRVRECCGERHGDRDCCGEHRVRECCGERRGDRDCCAEQHRVRECCGERRGDRDCCGERRRRESLVWRWRPPPCDYCRQWEWAEPF
jgi:hypothetical protein